jgi:adenylate kinase
MNDVRPDILQAILLLGPTGSGKTPLGDWLETRGLWNSPCRHFDFGANLRAAAAAGPTAGMTRHEIDFLKEMLAGGALLESESFYLAIRILNGFILQRTVRSDHWLVLNGLPRHVAQAQALSPILRVHAVIQLECEASVVRERLRHNAGGDRLSRTDDRAGLVARKLADYEARTRPLAAHYRERGARIIAATVGIDTQPAEIAAQLG